MALPRLTGLAAVFAPAVSEDIGFIESLKATVFDRSLRSGQDVRALVEHDPKLVIGRTKSGTLKLSVEAKGLRAEIDPPDTTAGRDVCELVRRQDASSMSFAFRTRDDDWQVVGGVLHRTLIDVDLVEVTVCLSEPAYAATSVAIAGEAAAHRGVPNDINRLRLRMSSS